jgi:hypothetical protein
MRKLVAISLFLLAAIAFERLDIAAPQVECKSEIVDLHKEQFECNHRHNVDAERPSTLVVPSARTTITNGPRTHTLRAPHIAVSGHFYTISKYVVARFIHRLGSLARAVDFYLYTLCRLRL